MNTKLISKNVPKFNFQSRIDFVARSLDVGVDLNTIILKMRYHHSSKQRAPFRCQKFKDIALIKLNFHNETRYKLKIIFTIKTPKKPTTKRIFPSQPHQDFVTRTFFTPYKYNHVHLPFL